jgi:hypothetical protein
VCNLAVESAMRRDAIYVVLFTAIGLALLLLHGPAWAAEGSPTPAASMDIEAGVTTNGAESPIGIDDFYLRQSHTLEFSGADDGLSLRGTLSFTQTAFRREDFEDDQSLGAELSWGRQVSPDWLLRGSLALRVGSVGDDVAIGGLYLATRTLRRDVNASIEAIHAAGDDLWRFALAYTGTLYDAAKFPDLPLPPTKLQADLHGITGAAVWQRVLGGAGTVLAGLEAQAVMVPEADQTLLGRLPSARLRGSVGYQADFNFWQIGAALGGDIVMSAYDNGRYVAPYTEATLTLPLGDKISLSVDGGMSVDLIDAIDGFASFDRRAGINAAIDLGRDIRFTAGAGMLWRRGVRDESFRFDEASLAASLSGALAEAWRWRLVLDRLRHREAGNDYDANGFGFGISGRI